jgi:hypothetical protein
MLSKESDSMFSVDVKVAIVDTEFSAIQLLNPSSQPVWML